jgi:pimeloyl-ACP methyl ester carboxylesterase
MKIIKIIIPFIFLLSQFLVQAQDFPFEIKKIGDGQRNLIFIPGFASSSDVFLETVEKLKGEHTCYLLTMPGFAGVAPQENPTFKLWKEQIAQFIQQKNIESPVIIGHSMGGGLAMAIAADYPDLIKKIVVVDALPSLAALSNPSFQSVKDKDCTSEIKQIVKMSDSAFIKMQKQASSQLTTQPEKAKIILQWSLKSDRNTFGKIYCDFFNTDLREKISSIKCPVLVQLESYFVNFDEAIQLQYNNLKNKKIVYANKGLHFIMYDDPRWYFETLNEFLAE